MSSALTQFRAPGKGGCYYLVRLLLVLTVFQAAASSDGRSARADELEFRIDSGLYYGDKKDPVLETKTLFHDGMAYDFMLGGSKEITILDPSRQRILLVDPVGQRWAAVSTVDILQLTAGVRELVDQENDPKQTELLRPTFQETFDDQSRSLILSSKFLTYEVVGTTPKFPAAAIMYRQFADWSARLNGVRGGSPPFGRLDLNTALEAKGLIPQSVTRTVISPRYLSRKTFVTRSDHLVVWGLSKTDRDQIVKVNQYVAGGEFKKLTFAEYLQQERLASGK